MRISLEHNARHWILVLTFVVATAVVGARCQELNVSKPPTIQELRDAETRVEQRAATVEKTITILAGASIIYGLLAAVGSYVGVKNARDAAKAEADKAKRDLDALQQDLIAAIPVMANINQSLSVLLMQLRSRIPRGWHATNEKIDAQVLQQIRYDEMTIAGLSVFLSASQASLKSKLSELHQGLGRFYGALYRQSAPSDATLADRSRFYFTNAIELNSNNFTAYRDRAALASMVGPNSEETWKTCALDYASCLEGKPLDAKALFGISWAHFKLRKHSEAIRELTTLVEAAKLLELEDQIYVVPYAYINRAEFVLARDGQGGRAFAIADCSKALEKAVARRDLDPTRYDEFCTDLTVTLQQDLACTLADGLPQPLQELLELALAKTKG